MKNKYHRVYIDSIASICYEANRAICEAAGDMSHKPWDDADDAEKQPAIQTVQYWLSFPDAAVGERHDEWMMHKIAEGWVCGPAEDAEAKTHPRLVPYDDLPLEQRFKDYVLRATVRSLK